MPIICLPNSNAFHIKQSSMEKNSILRFLTMLDCILSAEFCKKQRNSYSFVHSLILCLSCIIKVISKNILKFSNQQPKNVRETILKILYRCKKAHYKFYSLTLT